MKMFKLLVHQKNFSEDELVINPKDFTAVQVGDIVEIYHPEDEYSRLLLQVKSLREDFQQKGDDPTSCGGWWRQENTISVEQSVATYFQLRTYKDVFVSVVEPKDVALDLVELTFKEQYYSRSDMWRMRKSLMNCGMYVNQKVEFASMRAQVSELWSKGDQVTCGVVMEDTRVTFRSSTAQVNIFIQMSCEMWDFDNYGDLYFEKAVGGFLTDLFAKWKESNCLHDVTITMFSRTFYDARTIDDFPMHMRECLQRDYKGRFYEDYYRVVVQNERYDDWTKTLKDLKRLFIEYPKRVQHYHDKEQYTMPKAWNSTAATGNFLEVLNMGLSAFETYYVDRCFDRTGKLSIVITPGTGVFEVDRELTNVTKQRTIDCGNGSDLVCMGEQPLHAVPLFKFHNKKPTDSLDVGDDYNIPHWINHSFYTSGSQARTSSTAKFVPRIKQSPFTDPCGKDNIFYTRQHCIQSPPYHLSTTAEGGNFPFVDYDEYDAQVFKLPLRRKKVAGSRDAKRVGHTNEGKVTKKSKKCNAKQVVDVSERMLDSGSISSSGSPSKAVAIPQVCSLTAPTRSTYVSTSLTEVSTAGHEEVEQYMRKSIVGSAGTPVGYHSKFSLYHYHPCRALINPFDPTRLHFKATSNRRRWAHAFPTDPHGASVQPHHQHSGANLTEPPPPYEVSPPNREVVIAAQLAVEMRRQRSNKNSESSDGDCGKLRSGSSTGSCDSIKDQMVSFSKGLNHTASSGTISTLSHNGSTSSMGSVITAYEQGLQSGGMSSSMGRTRTSSLGFALTQNPLPRELGQTGEEHCWLWGVTGEQEWTPETTTGMDWKSMTWPASLPITTDYFPDSRSLQIDYVISDYSLLPEDFNSDMWQRPSSVGRKPLTTRQVYQEMVAQRLAQGFQLIVMPRGMKETRTQVINSGPYQGTSSLLRARTHTEAVEEHTLSIGRIFHKLNMNGKKITVQRFWPRHPHPQKTIHYTYRFQVPDSESYDVSWTDFSNEKLESYNWNYLDQYICTRGEGDFGLMESLKYWKSRYFLLPCSNPATKKIIDGQTDRCDIYEEKSVTEQQQLVEYFLRFIEVLNKIRRPGQNRKPKKVLSRRSSFSSVHLCLERDRVDGRPIDATKLRGMDSPPVGSMNSPSQSTVDKKMLPTTPSGESSLGSSPYKDGKPEPSGNVERALTFMDGLSVNSSLQEIVEAMQDANEGLSFLVKQQGLPELPAHCFVSGEAVMWVKTYIEGISTDQEAIDFMQRMIDEQLVCHASGNPQHKFIFGFYLYYLLQDKTKSGSEQHLYPSNYYYNTSFSYEWCEVAIQLPRQQQNQDLAFLQPVLPHKGSGSADSSDWSAVCGWGGRSNTSQITASPIYKVVNVDIDFQNKSEREEWGTARYHGNYSPLSAFELEVEWMVATGCIMGELIWSYARKATGFHFLPVPVDPFALPYTPNSDPLRGPIFVPLYIEYISEGKLFDDFDADTREDRLQMFQETILKRFGFMKDRCDVNVATNFGLTDDGYPQYVHCSGGMFALILDNKLRAQKNRDGTHKRVVPSKTVTNRTGATTPPDYIARQRSRAESLCQTDVQEYKVGYMWSWNFMLTKRWRSSHTGDEHFQDTVLADFRAFCSNKDHRLVDFWESCKQSVWTSDNPTDCIT